MVHPANEQDRIAGKWLLKRLPFGERLKLFIFDSGYASDALMNWCQQLFGVETQSHIGVKNNPLSFNPNVGLWSECSVGSIVFVACVKTVSSVSIWLKVLFIWLCLILCCAV